MALEFDWISLNDLGSSPDVEGKQYGTLNLTLDEGHELFWPTVRVDVLVDRHDALTWAELEGQARGYAINALKAATRALESASISELRRSAIERKEQRDKEREAEFQASLTETFGSR